MSYSPIVDFNGSPAQVIKQGSKSFALASIFLPARCRDSVFTLYRWCRFCDDAIDQAADLDEAKSRLAMLEDGARSKNIFSGPQWLDSWHRAEFIAGMKMDVESCHYETMEQLETYCFRVAGVVGLMMCPLLGAKSRNAHSHAKSLGMAMQLTNISRDVQADALLGRMYLPQQLLADVDAKTLAVRPELAHPAVVKLLARADELYDHGFAGIYWLPWRVSFAIAIAGKLYQRIGHKLLKRATSDAKRAFARRTVVSPPEKMLLVIQAVIFVFKIKALGLMRTFRLSTSTNR